MSGICGAVPVCAAGGVPVPRAVLDRMTDALRHRGRHRAGCVLEPGLALGVRQQLTLGDDEATRLPAVGEGGRVWAAVDGRVHNAGAVQRRVAADATRLPGGDAELVARLYERVGPALCEEISGELAFAVWDLDAQRGVLVRDRIGAKPLYYTRAGDVLVFASELKAVLASGLVDEELDLEALAAHLALGFIPAPMTPLAGVRKLRPGEMLMVGHGAVRHERWWRLPEPAPEEASQAELAEELRAVIDDAVRLRVDAGERTGVLLGGDVGSSLLLALAAGRVDQPLRSFAVGGAGELGRARRVAAALGAEHRAIELPLRPSPTELDRLTWHLDEPVAAAEALGFLGLGELASRHVDAILVGLGVDELLAVGGARAGASAAGGWRRWPERLRPLVLAAAEPGPAAGRSRARPSSAPGPAHLLAASGLLGRGGPELFAGAGAAAGSADAAGRSAREARGRPGAVAPAFDGRLGLADGRLHWLDRLSAAAGIDVRVPYLDPRVVELSARIPDRHKLWGLQEERVLRTAARGIVPARPLLPGRPARPRSPGPSRPDPGLAELAGDLLLRADPRCAELIEPRAVARTVRRWRSGDRGADGLVLGLVMLELWLDRFLPAALAAGRAPLPRARLHAVAST